MPGEGRRRLRLITMAWGEAYIKELFDITLAAALAPGNLPALAPLFDCDMVILTEESWFERLRQHPAFGRIGEHCPVHLRSIDEFITRPDAYGMALTYALFRGFEEFGDEMVDVQLVFLNSDFVLADGSLRTVAAKILDGERLILAPSYCVVAEDVTPGLITRRDRQSWSLVVAPRELAAMTITHRHNTIRAKTINQRLFSLEWMDQFYFLVDRATMIARQFPIAVVSMRPERVLTDMATFWDYGIVSEACPTAPRCVLADSDDFLMTELRGRDTARPQIRLGWPSARQIASKLFRFITPDPVELARHTLVLHAGEIPSALAAAKAELDRFVGAILAFLPAPMSYKDHYIWRYHYPTFQKLRAEYLAGRGLPVLVDTSGLVEHPPHPSGEELERAFDTASAGVTADMVPQQISSPTPPQRFAPVVYDPVAGLAPLVNPYLPDLDPIRRAIAASARDRILNVRSQDLAKRLFDGAGRIELKVDDVLAVQYGQPDTSAYAGLALSIAEAPSKFETSAYAGRQDLKPGVAATVSRNADGLPQGQFDICICELSETDLLKSRELVNAVVSRVRPGGSIFLFHWNRTLGHFDPADRLVELDALAFDFPSRLYSAKTLERAGDIRRWEDGLAALRGRGALARLRGISLIGRAMWSALRTNLSGNAIARDGVPDACTSVTIELEVTS